MTTNEPLHHGHTPPAHDTPIVRIVQMTFRPEAVPEFLALFSERRHIISGFAGCTRLELWQDARNPALFFTYSTWLSESHLDHYRFSEFFKDTWGKTKALFAARPQAWSVVNVPI